MAIYNINPKINEIFTMIRLHNILNLQETEEEAISTLKGSNGN